MIGWYCTFERQAKNSSTVFSFNVRNMVRSLSQDSTVTNIPGQLFLHRTELIVKQDRQGWKCVCGDRIDMGDPIVITPDDNAVIPVPCPFRIRTPVRIQWIQENPDRLDNYRYNNQQNDDGLDSLRPGTF
jgi:hypothetical protein